MVVLFSIAHLLFAALVIRACVYRTHVAAPRAPDRTRIDAIRVVRLVPDLAELRTVSDHEIVDRVLGSAAFGEHDWIAADGRELVPLYRFELLEAGDVRAIYYYGANSYPARFPCYSFCSGWWLGASQPDGSFDPTRYSGLTSSMYFSLMSDLELP